MPTLQLNCSDGIDTLCKLLPDLGSHIETRSIRDAALRLAAQLLDGSIISACMEFHTADGQTIVVVIGDDPEDRASTLAAFNNQATPNQQKAKVLFFPRKP